MDDANEILIEKFLAGKLTEQEEHVFSEKMIDAEFAAEVTFYKQLKTAAIIEGDNQLREKLQQIRNEYPKTQKPIFISLSIMIRQVAYPLAASIFFMIAISSLIYNKSSYNSSNFSKRGSITSIAK